MYPEDKIPSSVRKYCKHCRKAHNVSKECAKCPFCGEFYSEAYRRNAIKQNQPKCPTCSSTNIQKISELRRGIHAVAWGILSNTARSQFECKNCGYKW